MTHLSHAILQILCFYSGAHRYLYPQYGEYLYLPPQRWLHNLEYGSVLMLYHPCANKMQVDKLKTTLRACVYRHIISPSLLLTPKHPLALLVWSNSLEMSVVHEATVVNFIKNFANKGPKSGEPNIQKYDAGLIQESRLVTDEKDSELCANIILQNFLTKLQEMFHVCIVIKVNSKN